MDSFVYEYPVKVYFGEGCVGQHLKGLLEKYGKTVLLAYGGGSIRKNGIYDEVEVLYPGDVALCPPGGKNHV